MKPLLFIGALLFISIELSAQNYGAFRNKKYPSYLIDSSIIIRRGLSNKIKMLSDSCSWDTRIGDKIDVFWLKTDRGNFFGHVYEYILDCDRLRLIYWQTDPSGQGKIVDMMIEPLESESQFVIAKRDHLKNRKSYSKYFKN
jgi:hypothetical protein